MKYAEVKSMNQRALGSWFSRRDVNDPISMAKSNYYSKLTSCGKSFVYKNLTRHSQCRSPLCCRCSRRWSRNQARNFLKQFPQGVNQDFVFMTVGIGYTFDVNDVYPMFGSFRTDFKSSVKKLRRRKKDEFQPWKEFATAGSLEIDSFRQSEFHLLGTEKQKQYLNEYAFKFDSGKPDFVFVVTYHAVVHLGDIPASDLAEIINKHSKIVHFKALHRHNTLGFNVRKLLRYSSKVRYVTTLANGKRSFWTIDQLKAYGSIAYRAQGRKSYKLFIGRVGSRKASVRNNVYI